MRFEIVRLNDHDGSAVDSTVVDAAEIGQRIYIRPAE
jgi:hypothetical protein